MVQGPQPEQLHALEHRVEALFLVVGPERDCSAVHPRVEHHDANSQRRGRAAVDALLVCHVALVFIGRAVGAHGRGSDVPLHGDELPEAWLERTYAPCFAWGRRRFDFGEQSEDGEEVGVWYQAGRFKHRLVLRCHRRADGRRRRV